MAEYGNCPFCNPTQRVLKENDLAQVVLSNPRKVPGHTLVVPKRHVEKPWELTKKEVTAVFELVFDAQQRLIKGGLGEGTNIRQNYLPFLKQNQVKVDHLHFHVIPRALNDYLYEISGKYEDDLFAELDAAEHEAVAKLFK